MRTTLNDLLADWFAHRPNVWIDGKELATIAGGYGWRSRCSDLRKRGLVIDNRIRSVRGHEDSCPALLVCDIPWACTCSQPVRYRISEYRYVPAMVEATR